MKVKYPIETAFFLLLLAIFNFPGLVAPSTAALFPGALWRGEAWRWLTFPWAHVSVYHLALDAAAFISLYQSLRCPLPVRLAHLAACAFFSGLLPILLDSRLEAIGLRGLSGIAHGLLVVTALESLSMGTTSERRFSIVVLLVVLGKCVVEQCTGQVLFARYHLGNVGLPVVSCHLGGVVGGTLSFAFANLGRTGWSGATRMLDLLRPSHVRREFRIKCLASSAAFAAALVTVGCHSWQQDVTLAGIPFEKARVERGEIIGIISKDQVIAGRPCRHGWVHIYTNGMPSGFTASKEIELPRFTIPPNTWVMQTEAGVVRICAFSEDTIVQGHLCRGGMGGPTGVQAAFYPTGALKEYYLRQDSVVQGVPCKSGLFKESVVLRENGKLKKCVLSQDFSRNGRTYKKGSRIYFDENGEPK